MPDGIDDLFKDAYRKLFLAKIGTRLTTKRIIDEVIEILIQIEKKWQRKIRK